MAEHGRTNTELIRAFSRCGRAHWSFAEGIRDDPTWIMELAGDLMRCEPWV